jgi:hypothetical protein
MEIDAKKKARITVCIGSEEKRSLPRREPRTSAGKIG